LTVHSLVTGEKRSYKIECDLRNVQKQLVFAQWITYTMDLSLCSYSSFLFTDTSWCQRLCGIHFTHISVAFQFTANRYISHCSMFVILCNGWIIAENELWQPPHFPVCLIIEAHNYLHYHVWHDYFNVWYTWIQWKLTRNFKLHIRDANTSANTYIHLIQKISPAIKKSLGPQEGYCERRCEIQGSGQWMAMIVG